MDLCRFQSGVGPEQCPDRPDQGVIRDVLANELAKADEVLRLPRQKAERDGVAAAVAPAAAAGPEEMPSLRRVTQEEPQWGRKMGAGEEEPDAELLETVCDAEPVQHVAERRQRDIFHLAERVDSRGPDAGRTESERVGSAAQDVAGAPLPDRG